jgi:scyllo-inositol 2-dehydrogenase (NAD+)
MKDIGIGVVGLGRLGYVHAFNLARQVPHAKLIAVCDMQADLAQATAAELGCRHYTEIRQMLANQDIDAVCVTTPTAYHVDPVQAVAEAGKPLFCEKPLADNWDDTVRLAKIIKDAGILCQMGFQRRFDPPYAEAAQMIRAGAIGKPVYFCSFSRDPFPPPPWACDPNKGGGLFIDMLLHDFDLARFLIQDEVSEVFADETNLVVDSAGIKRFADNVTVNLHFKQGALGAAHASMHAGYGYDVRSEVFGAKGNLILGGLNRTDLTLCTPEWGISRPQTFLPAGKFPHFMLRFKEAYIAEMKAFVDCVLHNTPPSVNADDAVKAFQIALAATKAAGEKRLITIEV